MCMVMSIYVTIESICQLKKPFLFHFSNAAMINVIKVDDTLTYQVLF